MLKVGRSKVPYKNGDRILGYDLIEYENNGFASADKYTPNEFDMITLLTSKNLRKTGWWTGQEYWGYRMTPDETVVAWRKCKEFG